MGSLLAGDLRDCVSDDSAVKCFEWYIFMEKSARVLFELDWGQTKGFSLYSV